MPSRKVPKPNMYDVARLAAVSHQTVSRVINNHESVRPETRQRVQDAMVSLGYIPNQAARALVTSKSHIIGVLASDTFLFGPAGLVHAMELEARRVGYVAVTCSFDPEDEETVTAGVEYLRRLGVEGVVVVSPQAKSLTAARRLLAGLPVLSVGVKPESQGELAISVDNYHGAENATRHLINLGHRRIAHLSGPESWLDARERLAGYRDTVVAAGLVPTVLQADWSLETGYRIGRETDWSDLTAVFAANDHLAIGLLRALRERGIAVPEKLSVVGFDDIPEAAYLSPALTTVRQNFQSVGQQAMQMLISVLTGKVAEAGEDLIPSLQIRDSTAQI